MRVKIFSSSLKLFALVIFVVNVAPINAEYIVDLETSQIGFTAYSRIHNVNGKFLVWRFKGKIDDDFRGKGKIVIALNSVNSGNAKRDKHLRNEDFFDVIKFPEAIYHIDGVQLTGKTLVVNGRLHLHGVERPINLHLQRIKTTAAYKLSGEITLQQKDFGMVYNSLINPVKSEVTLKLHIVLKKK